MLTTKYGLIWRICDSIINDHKWSWLPFVSTLIFLNNFCNVFNNIYRQRAAIAKDNAITIHILQIIPPCESSNYFADEGLLAIWTHANSRHGLRNNLAITCCVIPFPGQILFFHCSFCIFAIFNLEDWLPGASEVCWVRIIDFWHNFDIFDSNLFNLLNKSSIFACQVLINLIWSDYRRGARATICRIFLWEETRVSCLLKSLTKLLWEQIWFICGVLANLFNICIVMCLLAPKN